MEDEAPQKASSHFEVQGELGTLAFLKHMPGTEIPADLGTKVLSFEKFKFLKAAMGMLLGSQKRDGSERKKGEGTSGEKRENTKKAFKTIILLATIAQKHRERDPFKFEMKDLH